MCPRVSISELRDSFQGICRVHILLLLLDGVHLQRYLEEITRAIATHKLLSDLAKLEKLLQKILPACA